MSKVVTQKTHMHARHMSKMYTHNTIGEHRFVVFSFGNKMFRNAKPRHYCSAFIVDDVRRRMDTQGFRAIINVVLGICIH